MDLLDYAYEPWECPACGYLATSIADRRAHRCMADLTVPDKLDGRIAEFVYRWIRPEVRASVTVELRALIAFAKAQA